MPHAKQIAAVQQQVRVPIYLPRSRKIVTGPTIIEITLIFSPTPSKMRHFDGTVIKGTLFFNFNFLLHAKHIATFQWRLLLVTFSFREILTTRIWLFFQFSVPR
jgi:hypothetical protein